MRGLVCCAVLKLACTVCAPLCTTMVSVVLPRCRAGTVEYQWCAPSMRCANAGGQHGDLGGWFFAGETKIWNLDLTLQLTEPLALGNIYRYVLSTTFYISAHPIRAHCHHLALWQ